MRALDVEFIRLIHGTYMCVYVKLTGLVGYVIENKILIGS